VRQRKKVERFGSALPASLNASHTGSRPGLALSPEGSASLCP